MQSVVLKNRAFLVIKWNSLLIIVSMLITQNRLIYRGDAMKCQEKNDALINILQRNRQAWTLSIHRGLCRSPSVSILNFRYQMSDQFEDPFSSKGMRLNKLNLTGG